MPWSLDLQRFFTTFSKEEIGDRKIETYHNGSDKKSVGSSNSEVLLLRKRHFLHHALVDAVVSSQVLPKTDITLVQLLADVALHHPLFEVDHLVVPLGTAKQGKRFSAQEAFARQGANLGHSKSRRQFCNKTKNVSTSE